MNFFLAFGALTLLGISNSNAQVILINWYNFIYNVNKNIQEFEKEYSFESHYCLSNTSILQAVYFFHHIRRRKWPESSIFLNTYLFQSCPGATFPGTPDDVTVDAIRTGDPPSTKYNDFLANPNALSGPLSLIPGVGPTYEQRLMDNGAGCVS